MPTDEDVMHNRSLYSSVASCSSGVELDQAQIVVVGNTRGIGGRYRIGHSVMRDALDQDGIWEAIRDAGLDLPERPHWTDIRGRLVNVFLKCEVSQDGTVHGRRNAMLDDSDVHWHRQIKSAVGGVTAAVTGDPAVFVSVSAAHQDRTAVARSRPSSTSARASPLATSGRRRLTGPAQTATHRALVTPLRLLPSEAGDCSVCCVAGVVSGRRPRPGEVHRHAGRLGPLDDLGVPDGATRGHDGSDARIEQDLQPVGEREERVGCRDRPPGSLLARATHGEIARVDPVDLPHADPDRRPVLGQEDGVGLDRADRAPRELQVRPASPRRRRHRRPVASSPPGHHRSPRRSRHARRHRPGRPPA